MSHRTCGSSQFEWRISRESRLDWNKDALFGVMFAVGISNRYFYLIEKNCSFCIVNTCKMFIKWIKAIVTQWSHWSEENTRAPSSFLALWHVLRMFLCVVLLFQVNVLLCSGTKVFLLVCVAVATTAVAVVQTNEFSVIIPTKQHFVENNFSCLPFASSANVICHWASFVKVRWFL